MHLIHQMEIEPFPIQFLVKWIFDTNNDHMCNSNCHVSSIHQERKTPSVYGPLKVGSPSVPPNASPSTSVGTTTTATNTTGTPSVSESCNQTSIQLLLQMMWYSHQKGRWSHSSMKADR